MRHQFFPKTAVANAYLELQVTTLAHIYMNILYVMFRFILSILYCPSVW